jgi:hypothetical protein
MSACGLFMAWLGGALCGVVYSFFFFVYKSERIIVAIADRNPKGEKPQALSAKHESAGRRHRPEAGQ